MRAFLLHWLLGAVALYVVAQLVPGISVTGFGAALIAALVFGAVNATLGLVLQLISIPITILTLGLFYFVINALMLMLAAALVPGFVCRGFLAALIGAVLLMIFNAVLRSLVSAGSNP
ncbi:MAG TPA: phage holin family protein [Acidobacteriota bacterium]